MRSATWPAFRKGRCPAGTLPAWSSGPPPTAPVRRPAAGWSACSGGGRGRGGRRCRPRCWRRCPTFRAARFDRAPGARIYTLNLPDELAAHASGSADLARLCQLAADRRLDGQVELEGSWRDPGPAIAALLERRIGGKAVLHID